MGNQPIRMMKRRNSLTTMDWFFAFSSFLLLIVACSGSEQRSSAVLEAIHTVLGMIQRDIKNVNQDIKDIKGNTEKRWVGLNNA